jgi:hypothetical protein
MAVQIPDELAARLAEAHVVLLWAQARHLPNQMAAMRWRKCLVIDRHAVDGVRGGSFDNCR